MVVSSSYLSLSDCRTPVKTLCFSGDSMLIVFDLEGTLVDAELLPALGELNGMARYLEEATEEAMRGRIDYRESLYSRVELLEGIDIGQVSDISRKLPIRYGAKEMITILHRRRTYTSIITGGFDVLANFVAKQLNIEYVYSNQFKVVRGLVKGLQEPVITDETKAEILKHLTKMLGVALEDCIVVGDGANDIPMMKMAGLSISFNGRDIVKRAAKISVESDDLRDILSYVDEFIEMKRTYQK